MGSLYSTAARAAPLATSGGSTGGGENEASGEEAEAGWDARGTGGDGLSGDGGGGAATRSFPQDDDRTPARRTRDAATNELIVGIANQAIGFGMTLANKQAVAK